MLPIPWTPQPDEVRSAGQEAERAMVRDFLDHQRERVHDLREPLLEIKPFMVDGRLVGVEYDRRESAAALEELRVRLSLPAGDVVKPLGMVLWLESGYYYGDKGRATRIKSYLYFHSSGETIDYCVPGEVVPSESGPVFQCGNGMYARRSVVLQGPLFLRQVQPWSWDDWDLLVALDEEEARENHRHEAAIADIHARRETYFDGLPQYEAERYNSEANVASHLRNRDSVPVPGAIWTNNRDQVAVIVDLHTVWRREGGTGNDHFQAVEMLFPDGRRQWVDIEAERWTGMPIWTTIGRAVVLERRLQGDHTWEATIEGEGHFPGSGRMFKSPWSFRVDMSDREFAVRLAAALGWASPAAQAIDLDGNEVGEPNIVAGQWLRVPYGRSMRWAQVCHVSTYGHPVDPAQTRLYLRDTEGKLYVLVETDVRKLNPVLKPPFMAGPVRHGIPKSPRLVLNLPEAPTEEPKALTAGAAETE